MGIRVILCQETREPGRLYGARLLSCRPCSSSASTSAARSPISPRSTRPRGASSSPRSPRGGSRRRAPSSPASRPSASRAADVQARGPRHHRGHQCGARAAGRARGRPHHRGLPRPHRDRPHQAQYPRALRAHLRAAQARRRAQAPLRGDRAAECRRLGAGAARHGLRRPRPRRRTRRGRRGHRRLHAPRVSESGARARGGRCGQGQAPRAARVVLGRRRGRVPRVRALLDHGAERVSPAADGRLPRRPRGAPPARGLHARRPHRRVLGRHDDDRDGAAPAHPHDLLRPRGRREPGLPRGRGHGDAQLHHL